MALSRILTIPIQNLLSTYILTILLLHAGVYFVSLFDLPNRAFYPHLAHITDAQLRVTMQDVLLYATMEPCSFLVLIFTIRRRLHILGLPQLAFVLEKHAVRVQWQLTL